MGRGGVDEDFEPNSTNGLVFCLSIQGCGNALHAPCFAQWERTSRPVYVLASPNLSGSSFVLNGFAFVFAALVHFVGRNGTLRQLQTLLEDPIKLARRSRVRDT